ncbi:PTS beta-glucoside transporter subunit EIIBCA [Niallia circulans]|uniref:PTS beta-glucoside transporter subunit EIIBCA n=1 Tax=Niallia circulans TaxID=1397 RepID=A0A553STH5_NIACI|nr:beta-glucoside-specific PTS transporter subunit IIABC [Niallia circulans]TRZ40278.1 PTS beta-glucoside transporter subunit EIIBCA [Niallia circulans]
MSYKQTAKDILENIGGSENINSVSHCVTRLRFSIKDKSKVNDTAIKNLENVSGTVNQGGQYQVIIGTTVDKVYKEFIEMSSFDTEKDHKKNKKENNSEKKSLGNRVLDVFISCFTPIIPVIAGAGMIKVLCSILINLNILSDGSPTLAILTILGDGVYYFLPFFVAFTAAQKLKTDHFTAMVLAAIILHPNFIALSAEGATSTSFLKIPMQLFDYSAQAVPVILSVWILSYVNRFTDKYSPATIKVFLRPMLNILIVAPIMLIVFGPIGAMAGEYFARFVDIMNTWGWIAVSINAVIYPFLVLSGTHNALIPLIVTMFATKGFDPVLIVSGLVVNIAQAGAAFAVATKTKNKAMRGTGISAGISAIFGITEPALYGVNLRLKKPFIAVLIGSALGGAIAGLTGVTAYSFVNPSVVSLPIFIGDDGFMSLLWTIISIIAAFIFTFIAVMILGFKDIQGKENDKNKNVIDKSEEILVEGEKVASPLKGQSIPITEVNDATFASEAMGKGVAIIPSEGKVVAPFDGTIAIVSDTKHAVAIVSEKGMEVLIHVGIDTVKLQGEHFQTFVNVGESVKKGDLLIEFNLNEIENLGYDVTTSIIVMNSNNYKNLNNEIGIVTYGDTVLNA